MTAHVVLTEVVLVMAASAAIAFALRRVGLPPVVGFILAGIAVGPDGLGLVSDRHDIEVLAEIGVVLLLFTIGLKLSLADLWRMRRAVFAGGALQVAVTGSAATGVAMLLGRPLPESIVWGILVALSSTALVLWLLDDGGDTTEPHGRTSVSILLFQDLMVVPAMVVLPLLAGEASSGVDVALLVGRSVAVIVAVIVIGRLVYPQLMRWAVASRSREIFTLTVVLVAVGTALLFGALGLSMALGAFFAGIVISESELVHRIAADVTPLRDVFNSLFFVSMGLLVDPGLWLEHPLVSLGLVAAVVIGKAAVAGAVSTWLLGSLGAGAGTGLALAQIGEFSVVVGTEASRRGLLGAGASDLFLSIAVPTMILTPLLLPLGRRMARKATERRTAATGPVLSDHVVIVGYGINGSNVARALDLLGVPHVVVDQNPHTVRTLAEAGTLAVCGDASRPAVQRAAGVDRARGMVVAVPDAASTREVVAVARETNPEATIVARTRYLREVEPLHELGADHVVPEEFETSIELTGRVLELYGAPPDLVLSEKAALRRSHYGLLRDGEAPRPSLVELLGQVQIREAPVPQGSPAAGATLRSLDLRRRTGATVIGVRRDGELLANPDPDLALAAGDTLVFTADAARAHSLSTALAPGGPQPPS